MATPFDFNWKYKDFEIRTTQTYDARPHPYVELIKWYTDENDRRGCFTLALWRWDDEGCELVFVGDRPLEYIADIDVSSIWKQLYLAQQMFMDWWEKERDHFDD